MDDQQKIISQYRKMRQEFDALARKSAELEQERYQHRYHRNNQ